jgi:MFS family permease
VTDLLATAPPPSYRPGRQAVPTVVGRLVASYACASVAGGLPWPLLLVLVWDHYGADPHGAWIVGLAGAARMAPYVLLSWAVGTLGDRVRRDRLVRATYAARLACLAAGALALSADRVGAAVVACALAVAAGTPTYPTIAAALPGLAGAHRARANQVLVTVEVCAWVVGPALGGLMLAPALRPLTLPVAVVLSLAAWCLVARVSVPAPTAPSAGGRPTGMLRTVWGCRPAVVALGHAGLLNLVVTVAGIALLPLALDGWGGTEGTFGLATAVLGFGALAGPLLARLVAMTVGRGLALLAGVLVVLGLSPLPWVALLPLALAGAAGVVIESLVTGTLQDEVPDHHRAGALGLADAVMVGSCLVGSLLGPVLVAGAGARPAVLLLAAAAVLPVLPGLAASGLRSGADRAAAAVPTMLG